MSLTQRNFTAATIRLALGSQVLYTSNFLIDRSNQHTLKTQILYHVSLFKGKKIQKLTFTIRHKPFVRANQGMA